MTYDMRIRTGPGEYLGGEEDYFSLNGSGMSKYLNVMYETGMTHSSDSPMEKDDWPSYDMELAKVDEEAADKKYAVELEHKTIRHGSSEEPNIPMHKFSTNDRWVVTPAEIKAALEVYDKKTPEYVEAELEWFGLNPKDRWYVWVDFLRKAKEHAGFRVM